MRTGRLLMSGVRLSGQPPVLRFTVKAAFDVVNLQGWGFAVCDGKAIFRLGSLCSKVCLVFQS